MSKKKKKEKQVQKRVKKLFSYFEGRPVFGYAALTLGLMILVFAMEQGTEFFRASLLQIPKFDGTVMPLKQSPNWSKTGGKNDLNFNQYSADTLIDLPKYDPKLLATKCDDPNDLSYQNACLTYTTVYMGNYRLDHKEFGGSHLAVDIRVPIGTPIYAVANGYVEIAEQRITGFGKYIVIRHEAVPLVGGGTDTLYSTYAHVSEVLAKADTVVKKGDLIGYTGNSGISTTPHLHFQIDRSRAPFHPWWPFTTAEASKANMTFFDGIDNGLGKEEAKKNTISPVEWVQNFLNYSGGKNNSANETPAPTSTNTEDKKTATPKPTKPPKESPAATTELQLEVTEKPGSVSGFEVETDGKFSVGKEETMTIKTLDDRKIFTQRTLPGTATISFTKGSGKLSKEKITSKDFKNGVASVSFVPSTEGEIQIKVRSGVIIGQSGLMAFEDQKGVLFSDVPDDSPYHNAIAELKEKNILSGNPDGSFRPGASINRAEFAKVILLALDISPQSPEGRAFTDVTKNAWFAAFAETAAEKGIVKGYPDGSFGPGKNINRAEVFAMLFRAAKGKAQKGSGFTDVPQDAWYADAAKFAKQNNLLDFGKTFEPGRIMTRAEVAEAVSRFMNLL